MPSLLRKPFTVLTVALLVPFVLFSATGCKPDPDPAAGKTVMASSVTTDPATELAKAHKGDARSQLTVGLLYLKGEGVPQDYSEARFWIEKAARQGLDDAEASLGALYREGLGTAQDIPQAKEWLEKAAAQGHASAQIGLAKLLLSENLTAENVEKARQWLEQASRQGMDEARHALSSLSGDGPDLKIDTDRLRSWLNGTPQNSPPTQAEDKAAPAPSR